MNIPPTLVVPTKVHVYDLLQTNKNLPEYKMQCSVVVVYCGLRAQPVMWFCLSLSGYQMSVLMPVGMTFQGCGLAPPWSSLFSNNLISRPALLY